LVLAWSSGASAGGGRFASGDPVGGAEREFRPERSMLGALGAELRLGVPRDGAWQLGCAICRTLVAWHHLRLAFPRGCRTTFEPGFQSFIPPRDRVPQQKGGEPNRLFPPESDPVIPTLLPRGGPLASTRRENTGCDGIGKTFLREIQRTSRHQG
jgi:hypothetical protein